MRRVRFEMLLLGDRLRDDWKALRVLGPWRYLYSTFIYRSHMRWLHKRGKHGRRTRPLDGSLYCDWCGYTQSTRSAPAPSAEGADRE